MDTKALSKLIRQYLAPEFQDFVVTNRARMALVPMNHLFRGFTFYGSANSTTSFYVEAVVMPLFVPTDTLTLLFGRRLSNAGTDAWDWDETRIANFIDNLKQAMRYQGLEWLRQIQRPLDLARVGPTLVSPKSIEGKEVIAYSLIYTELFDEAESKMEELCTSIRLSNSNAPWAIEWGHRSQTLLNLLKTAPHKAKEQLLEWEQQTIKNLKLEKLAN